MRGTDDEPYWMNDREIAQEKCGDECDCRRSDPPETWCHKHHHWHIASDRRNMEEE